MEAILDSSFIISCIRRKIDFITELQGEGFKIKLPKAVMQELKDLKKESKTSRKDRESIDIAFQLLERNKNKIKKIKL